MRHGVTAIAVGLLWLIASPAAVAQTYLGSDACTQCHLQKFADWSGSGHPFKLMESEDARNRPIPLPEGYNWDDISYVIGGFKWKARYIDNNGYIITEAPPGNPGNNQWNYLTGQWSDYHAGEANKPYDCGRCHTTGYSPEGNEGGLPGMIGQFEFGGIHCEACHGPGAEGPGGNQPHGYKDTSAAACGQCHVRGDENTIPASGGFIRHHEQWNELLASPHGAMNCVSCHDPHKTSNASIKAGRTCEDCHSVQATAYESTNMFASGVECIDCHMGFATKSAQALGPYQGDVWTHLFNINTDADYEMFNQDGSFVNLDMDGKAGLNLEFACLRCHGGQTEAWAETYAEGFHDTEFKITGGISGTWWGGIDRDGEGWLIDNANAFVAAFYTYNNVGDTEWVLGVGVPETAEGMRNMVTVTLEIPVAPGPFWGTGFNAANKNTVPFGEAKFTFFSCTTGEVQITPNATYQGMGFEAYTIPISRLTTPEISCPGTG